MALIELVFGIHPDLIAKDTISTQNLTDMKMYSYVVTRDFGFAPNPFHGVCTLATCKPVIRRNANIGDWVIGTGSVTKNLGNQLIYAIKVTKILTFQEYWNDERFICKKPVMNGSLVQMYGDNIYWKDSDTDEWHQENSHHSHEDGSFNTHNLKRDIPGENVLISDHFYYFGSEPVDIPSELLNEVVKKKQGHKIVSPQNADLLVHFLLENCDIGYNSDPMNFNDFQRYDGK